MRQTLGTRLGTWTTKLGMLGSRLGTTLALLSAKLKSGVLAMRRSRPWAWIESWFRQRHDAKNDARRWTTTRGRRGHLPGFLLIGYLMTVALVVLWPTPVDRDASGTILQVLAKLHAFGAPDWIDYNFVETSANIVMFVPIGLLGGTLLRTGYRWIAVPAAFSVSFLIELVQDTFLPGRFGTMQDVLANTHGAALGLVVLYAFLEYRRIAKEDAAAEHPEQMNDGGANR
jgi:glycopeptide antibiotics resistance protein